MDKTFNTYIYSGNYGCKSKKANVIVSSVFINTENKKSIIYPEITRHLVLIIDESISMEKSAYRIKSSLMTLYHLLINTNVKISLIYFNNDARLIWDNIDNNSIPFEKAVKLYKPDGLTNLQAGIECGIKSVEKLDNFNKKLNPTWFICMSDGYITKGIDSVEYLKNYIDSKSISRLITTIFIGYGEEYSILTLQNIGSSFVHVNDNDVDMAITMGQCVNEIFRSVGFNGYFTIDEPNVESDITKSRIIFGKIKHNIIMSNINIMFGYIPFRNVINKNKIDKYIKNRKMKFVYTDLSGDTITLKSDIIKRESNIPLNALVHYYMSSSERMINKLVYTNDIKIAVDKVLTKLNDWDINNITSYPSNETDIEKATKDIESIVYNIKKICNDFTVKEKPNYYKATAFKVQNENYSRGIKGNHEYLSTLVQDDQFSNKLEIMTKEINNRFLFKYNSIY